jgi:hypothetical protein
VARLLLVARFRVSGSRRFRTIADAVNTDVDFLGLLATLATNPHVSSFSAALKLNEKRVSESAPGQKRGQVLPFRKLPQSEFRRDGE